MGAKVAREQDIIIGTLVCENGSFGGDIERDSTLHWSIIEDASADWWMGSEHLGLIHVNICQFLQPG